MTQEYTESQYSFDPFLRQNLGSACSNRLYSGDSCQQPQNCTLTEQLGCKYDNNKLRNTPPRKSTCLFAPPIRPPKGVLGPPFEIFHALIQIQSSKNDAWRRIVALQVMTISSTWCGAVGVPAARRAAARLSELCKLSARHFPNSPPIAPLQNECSSLNKCLSTQLFIVLTGSPPQRSFVTDAETQAQNPSLLGASQEHSSPRELG